MVAGYGFSTDCTRLRGYLSAGASISDGLAVDSWRMRCSSVFALRKNRFSAALVAYAWLS